MSVSRLPYALLLCLLRLYNRFHHIQPDIAQFHHIFVPRECRYLACIWDSSHCNWNRLQNNLFPAERMVRQNCLRYSTHVPKHPVSSSPLGQSKYPSQCLKASTLSLQEHSASSPPSSQSASPSQRWDCLIHFEPSRQLMWSMGHSSIFLWYRVLKHMSR